MLNHSFETDANINNNSASALFWHYLHPHVVTLPETLTQHLECGDAAGITAALAAEPEAINACGGDVTVTEVLPYITTPGSCNNYTIVRKWIATDEFENKSVEYVQTITVADTEAPLFDFSYKP